MKYGSNLISQQLYVNYSTISKETETLRWLLKIKEDQLLFTKIITTSGEDVKGNITALSSLIVTTCPVHKYDSRIIMHVEDMRKRMKKYCYIM